MNDARADSPAAWLAAPKPPDKGRWPLNRWLILIALVLAVHVALLFVFGSRKQAASLRAVANVPTLTLAGRPDEMLALNDPTLFALPRAGDFAAGVWAQPPVTNRPSFAWTEPPRWLSLSAADLMMAFNRFMQTNRRAEFEPRLKPSVRLSALTQPIEPALAQSSVMRLGGNLAQRRLLTPMNLPSWPYADVIAPSLVRVLVNEAGDVVSAVLLPSDSSLEALSHYEPADQCALELARAARFAPAPRLTIGRMLFDWHTVPPPATNAPAGPP